MESTSYELLKIETKIDSLEKELSNLFADLKKYEAEKEVIIENEAYKKLEKMNVCCLNLLQTYREYAKTIKKSD